MSRFQKNKKDSLDLLLDTICNAFGGIVLIAILITLLTQHAKESVDPRSAAEDRDVVEQQISDTQRELAELQKYLDDAEAAVKPGPSSVGAYEAALARLQKSRADNSSAWQEWQSAAQKAGGDDPEADKLFSDRALLARRLADAKSAEAAAAVTLERIQRRLVELAGKVQEQIASRTEKLRLPKEGATGGGTMSFVLRFNEVFPLYFAKDGSVEANGEALGVADVEADTWHVSPKRGLGVPPAAVPSRLGETLQLIKQRGSYAAIYVDAASVGAYRALRKELVDAGVIFGWEHNELKTIIFGPDGSSPPPL